MRTFSDTQGRQWQIAITIGSAKAVKDALGVDLLAPEVGDPNTLTRLSTDEYLLGSTIATLLAGQFDKYGLSEADVANSFDGATLLAAQQAFCAEWTDFFRCRGRSDRAAGVAKQMAVVNAAIAQAAQQIEQIDPATLIAGVSSGNSPAQ